MAHTTGVMLKTHNLFTVKSRRSGHKTRIKSSGSKTRSHFDITSFSCVILLQLWKQFDIDSHTIQLQKPAQSQPNLLGFGIKYHSFCLQQRSVILK